jgi:arabinan endo-1,5-alpha-L-arabinosidase
MTSTAWKLLASVTLSTLLIGCGGGSGDSAGGNDTDTNTGTTNDTDGVATKPEPEFRNIAVHDPSIIQVDETFYIFGSHLSAAKSNDLMKWERVADGVNSSNPLFDDVLVELAEAFDWANANTLWAADVAQLDDGRFYMYYNACQGDAPRSAMGIAVADSIEGPYQDRGIFCAQACGMKSAKTAQSTMPKNTPT